VTSDGGGRPDEGAVAAWEDMVLVGRISRSHGLRGDVLIQSETDFPETRFAEGATLYAQRGGVTVRLEVERSRVHANRPLVAFRGLDSIEAVDTLGRELRIPESALAPLPDGEYYWYQLVGAPVRTEAGEEVGRVLRVEPTGDSGVLVVARGDEEVQVPLTPALCPVVRPDLIVVRPPDGLLDLNTPGPKRRAHRHRDHLSRHGAGRPPGGDSGAGGGQRSD
jgi:16S rRNA processing protein RimM